MQRGGEGAVRGRAAAWRPEGRRRRVRRGQADPQLVARLVDMGFDRDRVCSRPAEHLQTPLRLTPRGGTV